MLLRNKFSVPHPDFAGTTYVQSSISQKSESQVQREILIFGLFSAFLLTISSFSEVSSTNLLF